MRLVSMLTVVCAGWCGLAWGQTASRPSPAYPSAASVGSAPPMTHGAFIASEMSRNGGSLAKASLQTVPPLMRTKTAEMDPAKARWMAVSFVAVPDPEPRVVRKHDLVTIIIREQTEYASDGNTDLKKEADLDARVDEWVKFSLDGPSLRGGGEGPVPPSVKMGGSRNFKGEATVDRTDSFVTRIAAEVVDVKPNGTFVVQARKFIKHDEEESEYLLTGVCRAEDLTPDNTILSTQVYNLEIVTNHKGAVKDTTKRGLIPKLLDFINPF